MTLHIEISEESQAKLAAEAEARGVPLDTLVGDLFEQTVAQIRPRKSKPTVESFHAMLRHMAQGSENLPDLPTESFTRESFYEERG